MAKVEADSSSHLSLEQSRNGLVHQGLENPVTPENNHKNSNYILESEWEYNCKLLIRKHIVHDEFCIILYIIMFGILIQILIFNAVISEFNNARLYVRLQMHIDTLMTWFI